MSGLPQHQKRIHRLHIGMRNFKTSLAVCIILFLYYFLGTDGSYLAVTSAIICMRDSIESSVSFGVDRLLGTFLGALWGIVLLYSNIFFAPGWDLTIPLASLGVMFLITFLNYFGKKDAVTIACVVFLIIVLQQNQENPLTYSIVRLLDTLFGIVVALIINRFIRNPDTRKPPVWEEAGETLPGLAGEAGGLSGKHGTVEETCTPSNGRRETIEKKKGCMGMFENMLDTIGFVSKADPEAGAMMEKELARQRRNLELIASENLVSPAVLAAVGTVLTNKYAEGYPGKRYYGGCECVDEVETLAIERAKKLFGAGFANVQPHSGAQANEAVYMALVEHGDTVLGMSLAQGGHLTHGSPVNFSGKGYNIVSYGVDNVTHRIDYDQVRKIALECKPKMIIAGASAYPREIDFKRFSEIAREVGAYLFVDMAHIAGLVAAGQHMSPIPYADVVTTTTHKTLRGIRGGLILTNNEELAVKCNKAVFPGIQGGPLMHVIAAKAVGLGEALKPEFKQYQEQIVKNAKALAAALMDKGFDLVSGGTDNHLMLVDLTSTGQTGKELEKRLDEVYITVNKNSIPNETRSPFVTSGIRIGTAAVTTRGLSEQDMDVVADCIYKAATAFDSEADNIRAAVTQLCRRYPLYQ